MRRLTRFWRALDLLPGAETDQRDWVERLGPDWPAAAPYLRSTGRLAEAIDCPSPGGENCPRRVVCHTGGRIRAVCGERPAVCDNLELSRAEITILALDRAKLALVLARALSLVCLPDRIEYAQVIYLGRHDVFAGRGIPVFLTLPGPLQSGSSDMFGEVTALGRSVLLLAPTRLSLGPTARAYLDRNGVTLFSLEDLLLADDHHRIVGARPASDLLQKLRAQVENESTVPAPARAWNLPSDARWEDLALEFTAEEVLNVRFRGETRRFEPEHLNMKNQKSGRPTNQWTLLRTMAEAAGRLGWRTPGSNVTVKKQKQLLSAALRNAFGIDDDPIVWRADERAYVSRFAIGGRGLERDRVGRRRR